MGTLRHLRSKAKDNKLQMLLRGQNLRYRNYADDVVRLFVENLYKTDIFVYSMLLNDVRKYEYPSSNKLAGDTAKQHPQQVQFTL